MARHGDLRAAREGLHPAPSRSARAAARHVCRALPACRSIEYLKKPRRDRGRAAAGARHGGRAAPAAARPAQLLGLQHASASSRPRCAISDRHAGRVQDHGEDAARGGHRGDPRRGLQPHRGGRPHRADALASAASTTRSTTASTRATRARYLNFTGTGNSLNTAHRVVLAHGDGQPALLGRGDARRRLPLRPRRHARAEPARRLRPQRRVPRRGAPGPGAVARQADRRALGHGRAAATSSATSRPAGRSGTTSIATRCAPTGGATAA